MPLGYILYEGPSLIDGEPIVVIATGFGGSSNRKTGDMIQTWILCQKEKPTDAIKSGSDASICGGCRHRGRSGNDRSCYVNVGQAPGAVYRAYRAGRYDPVPQDFAPLAGRKIRFGAYGDPAAAPACIWLQLAAIGSGHTGYTHQWRDCDPALRRVCMASVDSELEHLVASAQGWRTFRVRPSGDTRRLQHEVVCPASTEAGGLLACESCLACGGADRGRRGHIVISVHGSAGVLQAHARSFLGIPVEVAA